MYETHPHFRPVGSDFGCGYAADVGWLRFYLDDAAYGDRDVYANEQNWEALQWMSSREVQSLNSETVLTYSGKYAGYKDKDGEYRVIDMAMGYGSVIDASFVYEDPIKVNLEALYDEIEENIAAIESKV